MTIQTEKEARERKKYDVKLSEIILQRSIKAGSVQSLFRRQKYVIRASYSYEGKISFIFDSNYNYRPLYYIGSLKLACLDYGL